MRLLPVLLVIVGALACSAPKKSLPASQAPKQSSSSSTTRLRILSYNIHHGEGTDQQLDLARIARIIRDANADLVALQEVDDRTTRSRGLNQAEELARLTGMKAHFGQAMPFAGGGYGQAILSRWPIESSVVYNLPQTPGREPRICVLSRITPGSPGSTILFASAHLEHELEPIRIGQAKRLAAILSTNQIPLILAGDLNATPESEPLTFFAESWTDAAGGNPEPTIPSERPDRRIDYVLLHPRSAWRVIESRVLAEPTASDHRPVLAVVERVKQGETAK